MDRGEIEELHYIAAIANVPSILEHGILCHLAAANHEHVSVADPEVQERRSDRRIPGGLRLHQYANLYFNARNAMLFVISHNYDVAKRVPAEELVILRVSPDVLDLPGVVVTDINAAAAVEPRWHTVEEGLPVLDRQEIHAHSWNHADPLAKRRHMQRMMAEVLVPQRVGSEHLFGAYVVSTAIAKSLTQVGFTLEVEVNPYMFFRGGRP